MTTKSIKILQVTSDYSNNECMLHSDSLYIVPLPCMVNVLKFLTLFSFYSQMLVIRSGIHKMLVRIAKREDTDLGLCLSMSLWQATNVQNFKMFTIPITLLRVQRNSWAYVIHGTEILQKHYRTMINSHFPAMSI